MRLYCDICEKFDVHDTEDCPTQATPAASADSHHGVKRGDVRPYCDSCEGKYVKLHISMFHNFM